MSKRKHQPVTDPDESIKIDVKVRVVGAMIGVDRKLIYITLHCLTTYRSKTFTNVLTYFIPAESLIVIPDVPILRSELKGGDPK